MISKLNIQPTIRLLTLPTRIGSGPENSSNTNIWFQTHPLLARLRILCPSLGRFRGIMADAICKLCDWLFNGAMEEYGTQVIHTSRREVHRSRCISSPRFSISGIFSLCLVFFGFPSKSQGSTSWRAAEWLLFCSTYPPAWVHVARRVTDALWSVSRTQRWETRGEMRHPLVGSSM